MTISRVSGNILQDNLVRGANLAIQGNLIYFDVSHSRVGVLNSTPTVAFDVTGNILGSNVSATYNITAPILTATANAVTGNMTLANSTVSSSANITLAPTGNIFVSNVHISDLADPIAAQDAATKNYVDGELSSLVTFEDDGANTTGIAAGDTVFFNGTVGEVNVVVSSLAVNFSLPANVVIGNSLTACVLIANSVAASSGKLSLGSNANITISGGANNYVLFTDGAGNLNWNPINSIGNLTVTDTTIGTVTGNTNIVLEPTGTGLVIIDTVTGLTIPVGNTDQRPAAPSSGTIRFNTTILDLEVYDGFIWSTAGGGNTFTITNQTISPDGSTTVYTLNQDATSASILLTINGVNQTPDIDYSVTGNALTMTTAPLSTDLIQVRFLAGLSTNNTMTNSAGNAVITVENSGNIDFQPSSTNSVNIYGNLLPSANVVYNLGSTSRRWNNLWLSGSTITLGNIVIKNSSGNTISFYGPDGVTPATLDANAEIVADSIVNGTSQVAIPVANGNIVFTANNVNSLTVTSLGAQVTGNLGATLSTAAQPYVTSLGTLASLSVSGNITGGNLSATNILGTLTTAAQTNITSVGTLGNLSVTGNIAGGNLSVGTGTITTGNILNSNANGVGNIGSSTTYFNTVFAKSTSAQYADLAEKFTSDQQYPSGTVSIFGGDHQVTQCDQYADPRAAGIVTTDPAYLMNADAPEISVAMALTGQVPCQVVGPIAKGDILTTSQIPGHARRLDKNDWEPGVILAKALESCPSGCHKILVFIK